MISTRLRSAALLLILGACQPARSGTLPATRTPAAPPSFYCEHSHTNYAWSYTHRGIYVDPDGGVFRFEHQRGDSHLLQVPGDSLTGQRLLARYAPGRRRTGTVAAAEMAERHQQVLEARQGSLSERRNRGADMGESINRCYLRDGAGIYREVFLEQSGDWHQENRSPAARRLSRWLDSLSITAR